MGKRGPRPQPTQLRLVRGNPGKRAINKLEPKPDGGIPTKPAWLVDPVAALKWDEMCRELDKVGVLTVIDGDALARYCDTWSWWKKTRDFLRENGDVYPLKDENGKAKCLMQFPQVAIAHKLAASLARLEQEFGLTPSSRSGITTNKAGAKDALADFLGETG